MTWKKGVSGNPAGRAKGTAGMYALIRRQVGENAEALVARTMAILDDPYVTHEVRLMALRLLWEYGFGKPVTREIEQGVKEHLGKVFGTNGQKLVQRFAALIRGKLGMDEKSAEIAAREILGLRVIRKHRLT